MSDEFVSVRKSSAVWEPKQTGKKKEGNLVSLEPSDKSFITGHYIRSEENSGPEGKSTIHYLKIEKAGDPNHVTGEVEDGEVAIWGTGVLNDAFNKVSAGQRIKVTWLGKKMSKGGNNYHTWDLGIDANAPLFGGEAAPAKALATPSPKASEVSSSALDAGDDEDALPF